MELEKAYEPQRSEPRWAQRWIHSGTFRAEPLGHMLAATRCFFKTKPTVNTNQGSPLA